MTVRRSDFIAGASLPGQRFGLERASMIRYAGASGDFNPIHWDEAFATSVGLPNVIAHGMLTMGTAVRVVTDWIGDPGAIVEFGVRFTRPVVVATGTATTLAVTGTVRSVDLPAGTAVIDVSAAVNGATVLARARVTVRIPAN